MSVLPERRIYETMYHEFMIKIGKEKRLRYSASSLKDLYICIEIEHDGVFDVAMIDLLAETIDMRIYDKFNFIIADHVKVPITDFVGIINDMSMYWDNLLNFLNKE